MNVLGLSFSDHEASAALVMDGKLCAAIARERITRLKRDGIRWGGNRLDLSPAIQYCLDTRGLKLDDIDLIVWSHTDHLPPHEVYQLLATEGGMDICSRPLMAIPHHFAHACGAYYSSPFYATPFKEAAVLIVDGAGGPFGGLLKNCLGPEPETIAKGSVVVQNLSPYEGEGSRELESFYRFDASGGEILRKVIGHWCGIGATYGHASKLIFGDYLDAGKTMGLAPYGRPYDKSLFFDEVGTDEFRAFTRSTSPERSQLESRIEKWRQLTRSTNYKNDLLTDFTASLQLETEEALITHARWLQQRTGLKRLCFSGGVALNCVANTRLAEETGFDEIFVPPCPGDDGIAVGCALFGASINGVVEPVTSPAYLGHDYSHEPERLEAIGLKRCFEGEDVFESVAQALADGAVFAWFEGGAELGPRALGHRSFLADPRRVDLRERLNAEIKRRESFRPFAPVVLEEAVSEYFVELNPSYFMSFVAEVHPEKREVIPAVTHVDGSARYQVLREQDNPTLFKLIEAFGRITGIPMLLNTSFNRAGEPLVETPEEAARCVVNSTADYLVVDKIPYQNISTGGLWHTPNVEAVANDSSHSGD
ncbi:MAG TPA: carbamoyltransferase C-terminal domain-containing protein [Pyrinomonadaceae bacterium]|nr:carbamoyltransferase C-terminal domain-containing protein [Pyrinomonadaceae bacterium]